MDDYRARFKSWKCPIKGELTVQAHPWSIEAFRAAKFELKLLVSKAKSEAVDRSMERLKNFNPFAGGYVGPRERKRWFSGSA